MKFNKRYEEILEKCSKPHKVTEGDKGDCDECHGKGTIDMYSGKPPKKTTVDCPKCKKKEEKDK